MENRQGVADEPKGPEWLARRLHEINVLDMTGNGSRANKAAEELNAELAGSHMRCWWSNDSKEWILQDTLLYAREEDNG